MRNITAAKIPTGFGITWTEVIRWQGLVKISGSAGDSGGILLPAIYLITPLSWFLPAVLTTWTSPTLGTFLCERCDAIYKIFVPDCCYLTIMHGGPTYGDLLGENQRSGGQYNRGLGIFQTLESS